MKSTETQEIISCRYIKKANHVLSWFCRFYLPIYSDNFMAILKNLHILICVESLIYRADYKIERRPNVSSWTHSKERIIDLLISNNLYDGQIAKILADGDRYVELEVDLTNKAASYSEVIRAMQLRPFDIRLLHLIYLKAAGKVVDRRLLKALWYAEIVDEAINDFLEREDDEKRGEFNTYLKIGEVEEDCRCSLFSRLIFKYERLFYKHASLLRSNKVVTTQYDVLIRPHLKALNRYT